MVGVPLRHHERSAQGARGGGLYTFQYCPTPAGAGWFLAGVLVLRRIDRAGKALRGAPRDALVADARPPIGFLLKTARKPGPSLTKLRLNTNPELSVAFRRGVGVSDASAGSACASDVTPEEGYDP